VRWRDLALDNSSYRHGEVKMNIKGLTIRNIFLKDLLDTPAFQNLCDSFTKLTGIPTAILNLEGEVLIASGWQKICTDFHRKNPIAASRCLESDTALANQINRGEKYNIYKCKNGMVDVAVPIIIEDKHVGNLFTGQFFFEPPDIDFFTRQAEELNFDMEAYLDSLSKVPVFSTERIKTAISFLADLTVVIGNAGLDKKRLLEYSKDLEQRIEDRTADLKTEISIRKKTEAELKQSQKFLESVFDAIQDGISVLDRNLNIVQVNRIMHEWYPQLEGSIREKCYKVYHGRTEACEICPSLRALKSNKMEMSEVNFTSNDNVKGTLELYSFPIKDSSGEVTGIVEYVRDITNRKQIENQVKIEKLFSDSLINSLPGVMYFFDQFGHFKRWNKNFEFVTGYSANQIEEMSPLDFITTEDRARVKKSIDQVFKDGISSVEAALCTIGGENIPYLFTGYKYIREGINYLVGVGLDISERIKTENEKGNLIKRLQETLSQVKQLSGLLPICSSCKKIRDDKGYWNQIESYIRKHAEVDFSHGLCPECAHKLYGDQDWYKKRKNSEWNV
jgi:PAS domain S-box-containing protein